MTKKLIFLLFLLLPTALQAQTWWGYWQSTMGLQPSADTFSGTTACGIRLTAATQQLTDSRVYGVRFWIPDKSAITAAAIWISAKPFADGEPDMASQPINLSQLSDIAHDGEPTTVMFDDPVAILPSTNRYASVYVGYTLTTTAACRLSVAGNATRIGANTCYIDWQNQEAANGPLAMQLLVGGAHIADDAVAGTAFDEQIVLAGCPATIAATFENQGATAVSTMDYEVLIDGERVGESHHVELPTPVDELGLTITLPVDLDVPAAPRKYSCEVRVTQVNGRPNTADVSQAEGRLIALSRQPEKRVVMEELTGTWCPNCPRGLVGMHLLEQTYGDRFVGIAIHGGDSSEPMRLASYDGSSFVRGLSSRMGGRPSCAIDRWAECDPYGGFGLYYEYGVDAVVDWMLGQPTVADLQLTAAYADAAQTTVNVDVVTTFRYSDDAAPYRLMLVVVADSLTGDTDDWLQVNTLVGKTEYDAACDEFVYGERRMKLAYNHVPVFVDGVEQGISASIAEPLVADAAQHFIRQVDIAACPIVQRKDCLRAIAMLIDTRSGHVANVAQAPVTAITDGIAPTVAAVPSGSRGKYYQMDGRPAASAARGIVIVRDAAGNARKIVR